jgi:hypothetical protein
VLYAGTSQHRRTRPAGVHTARLAMAHCGGGDLVQLLAARKRGAGRDAFFAEADVCVMLVQARRLPVFVVVY